MSKVKFTSASRHENGSVTVRVNELKRYFSIHAQNYIDRFCSKKNANIILTIDGVRVLFRVNRVGETLITKTFPANFKVPKVGSPVKYAVTCVEQIKIVEGVAKSEY